MHWPLSLPFVRPARLGRWLLWCLIAWLAARVIAGAAQLIWQVAHPPAGPAITASQPLPGTLPPTNAPWSPTVTQTTSNAVPLTQLPLTFLGALRTTPLSRSLVVLQTPAGARVVMAGETIYDAVGLRHITADGLILDNDGRAERLPWPQPAPSSDDAIVAIAARPASATTTLLHADWPQAALRDTFGDDYRQRLLAEPQRLTPYLEITAVMSDVQLQGYRLEPGQRPALFAALPLQAGDVVTTIGDRSAAELSAAQLAQAFATSRVTLGLIRDGVPVTLVLESSP